MGIITAIHKQYSHEGPNTLASLKQAYSVLSQDNEFIDEVLSCYSVKTDEQSMKEPLLIGNVKQLLADISELDKQTDKIDAIINLKNIHLDKVLENEHVLFNIYGIQEAELIKRLKADHLTVESRYSARTDVLEYYNLSKFASFLHTNNMDSYARQIWETLRTSSIQDKKCMARLIYHKEEEKYYIRAITSANGYKRYGINFSVLVILLALNEYVKNRQEHVFIESYEIDDSRITMSIQFDKRIRLDEDMYLTLNLSLENDEIRQSSVILNAEFRVVYKKDEEESDIFIKPTNYLKEHGAYSQDMLTYSHGVNVKTAISKVSELPKMIDKYIEQVSKDAVAIKSIKEPKLVQEFIQQKIKNARKDEFVGYKPEIIKKLASMEVNSVFELFELLRKVEELFGDDIKSKNFWREKLYEALIKRGKEDK